MFFRCIILLVFCFFTSGSWSQLVMPENTFWSDGKKKEEYLKLGGNKWMMRSYDSLGVMLLEASYRNNQEHGTWKTFFSDGRLHKIYRYYYGRERGRSMEYYQNGQVKNQCRFSNGAKAGKEMSFYENGEKERVSRYRQVYFLENVFVSPPPSGFEVPDAPLRRSCRTGREVLYDSTGSVREIHYYDYFYCMEYDYTFVNSGNETPELVYKGVVTPVKMGKWEYFNERGKIYRMEFYEKNRQTEIIEF